MKRLIFLLSFAFMLPAFCDVYEKPLSPSEISKQIPKIGSIKCRFRQEKSIQNISKPLISGGEFEFIENEGIYFHTTYPIKSETNFTNQNYKQINDIVKAISAKKYSKLEKEFSFFFENMPDKWTLGMKPKKESDSSKFISKITICGSDYINKIEIIQINGNKTTLWFTK